MADNIIYDELSPAPLPDAGAGRGSFVEGLNDRANALALAAGAKPGDTVNINGAAGKVAAANGSPSKPPKTPNKRLDDHIKLPDKNLVQGKVLANGDHVMKSLDKAFLGMIQGVANELGFNVKMHGPKGDENHSSTNGVKKAHAHETKTISGSSGKGVGGAQHSTTGQGGHTEHGKGTTSAVNGTQAKATAASSKTFAQGGNGPQAVKGDYSLAAKEGGVHFEAAKDFTVSAKTTISLGSATGELSLNTKGGNVGITTQGGTITLNSPTVIEFVCGESLIRMFQDRIIIKSPQIDLNP